MYENSKIITNAYIIFFGKPPSSAKFTRKKLIISFIHSFTIKTKQT